MKKRLRFLYRYLIAAGGWRRLGRRLFDAQVLLIVVVSGIFLSVLFSSAPRSNDSLPRRGAAGGQTAVLAMHAAQTLPAPEVTPGPGDSGAPTSPTPTRTPFPPEFYENADQAFGITLAGVALVLIVFVGAWSMRPKQTD